jgi:hypothetical protein
MSYQPARYANPILEEMERLFGLDAELKRDRLDVIPKRQVNHDKAIHAARFGNASRRRGL